MTSKRINNLCNEIHFRKAYCLLLKKRTHLIKKDYSSKDDFQRNEVDIAILETTFILIEETKRCERLEVALRYELEQYYQDLKELDENYANVIDLAKKNQNENIELKHFLYDANWKSINEDIDEKIKIYKNIKNLLKC
jgi:hypothetical protein